MERSRGLGEEVKKQASLSLLLIVDLNRSTISRRSIGAQTPFIDRGVNLLTIDLDQS